MAGTFSQIQIHVVFSVKARRKHLDKIWRTDLFKYMSGIILGKGAKPFLINGIEDHVHLLIGIQPKQRISDLIRDVKNNSSKWINENEHIPLCNFRWQEGYAVFSFSSSSLGGSVGPTLLVPFSNCCCPTSLGNFCLAPSIAPHLPLLR